METLTSAERRRLRLRAQRRARFRDLWRDARWWVIGGLALTAVILGYLGFRQYQRSVHQPAGFLFLAYKDVQLFVLESGSPTDGKPLPATLEAAKFLAPLVGGITLLAVLAALLHDQFQRARLRFAHDHVVICGVGAKGIALARSLREHGYRVVSVERDEATANTALCTAMGVPVVTGDATDAGTLRSAGACRAAEVIAVTGESATNAHIATILPDLAYGRRDPLDCLAHIDEPRLCDLLRTRYLAAPAGPVRLDFFNVFERGAQVLLLRHPFCSSEDAGPTSAAPHLLVVGLGQLGQSLIVQAVRNWRTLTPISGPRFRITAVDRDATRITELLAGAHPEIAAVCDLLPAELDVSSPGFETGAFMCAAPGKSRSGTGEPSIAYVCFDDDARALRAGLGLQRWIRQAPIVIRSQTSAGLPALLRDGGGSASNLHGFPLLDNTCNADLLLGGTYELLAHALHADYVQHRRATGWTYSPDLDRDRRTDPALAVWRELPEEQRESNRSQAAHVGVKLAAVDCSLDEITDWQAPLFTFTPEQVERLAELEHERWASRQRLLGWKPGTRDPEHRNSPYLVPYVELPEDVKEYNRMFVRDLPRILAMIGQRIVPGAAPVRHTQAGERGLHSGRL